MYDTATTADVIEVDGMTDLYHRYDGENAPQPVYLQLDIEQGTLSAGYTGQIGGGVPADVYNRRTLWWDMPILNADDANELLHKAQPTAQRILDGASIEWDGNAHVGEFDDDATEAIEALRELVDTYRERAEVTELDAEDWYDETEDPAADLGITADTTDEEVYQVADRLDEKIESGADSPTVAAGSVAFVTRLRDKARDTAREELEALSDQIDDLTEQMHQRIRRMAAWREGDKPVESSRSIGEIVGLSHTQVQRIIRGGEQ